MAIGASSSSSSKSPSTFPALLTKDLPPAPHVTVQDSTPVEAEDSQRQRHITLTDSPPPPAQQDKAKLKAPQLTIDLKKTKEEGARMNRSFSFRRTKSASKPNKDDAPPMPELHARGNSWTTGQQHDSDDKEKKAGNLSPPVAGARGDLQRSMSRREKFAKAIANPDMMFTRDPQSPPPESKFNVNPNSKFARTFFGSGKGIDFGSGVPLAPPTPPTPTPALPDADTPLFSTSVISTKIATELPHGYTMRPLCRGDYYRGYMDVQRVLGRVGWVSEEAWEERCEWLRGMGSTYFMLVVVGPNGDGSGEKVVASGTLMVERKFVHGLGSVGHIEDIAVAKDQKGRKMGLRVLEALVFVAVGKGCYKTMVDCSEGNEGFHAQAEFSKEGSQMVLHHVRKKEEQHVYS